VGAEGPRDSWRAQNTGESAEKVPARGAEYYYDLDFRARARRREGEMAPTAEIGRDKGSGDSAPPRSSPRIGAHELPAAAMITSHAHRRVLSKNLIVSLIDH
jgi:hypothetical protein